MSLPVDILITNRNSCEAIQLCVESVRRHTRGQEYQIIVYDDCSDNDIDLPYLREKQAGGWLRLIEGKVRTLHGGSLNALLNDESKADLAVILDCDVQILADGWLDALVALVLADPQAIGAVTVLDRQLRGPGALLAPFGEFWFAILNMRLYRNGMQVDWRPWILTKPEDMQTVLPAGMAVGLNQYIFDVGGKLPYKLATDNPHGYHLISPLPEHVNKTFLHYRQISHQLGTEREDVKKWVNNKRALMRAEIEKLRAEA